MTNHELWRWRVQQTPERRWLWYDGRTWSFGEFDEEVRRLASGLRQLGVRPGVRVLIGMNNRPETVMAHLALIQLGAVIVPLIPGMPFTELKHPIIDSEARILIADDPLLSVVVENVGECAELGRIVAVGVGDVDAPGVDVAHFEEVAAAAPLDQVRLDGHDENTLAHVLYTSGSTGKPKGVMLKGGSLYASGLGYSDRYAFSQHDTYFLATSLAHSLSAIAALGIGMLTGGGVAMVERFRPSTFWSAINESRATVSVLFATHLNLLLETDDGTPASGESSLRFVVTHIDHPRFRERFGVEMGTVWGMTETLVCIGSDPGYAGQLGAGYVGYPWPGAEVAVFHPDTFTQLGAGEPGELRLRHPQVMLGYLNDPDATARTLVDGWVRSGDRAIVDYSGRTYFAGRFKSMIKRSGENISAEEVEEALADSEAVAECVVFGVPDHVRSEEVAAVVVRRRGMDLDPAELRASCAQMLVRWKLPRYIVVQDEPLPRLPTGKVDRVSLAAAMDPASAWDAQRTGVR
jgi:crotonobetaine/carnitine-CoA ligase